MRLYHAPQSRSTRILWLIEELGIREQVTVTPVRIRRQGEDGPADPANPHPEGKVPAFELDGALMTESAAVLCALCERFPQAGLAPAPGDPQRGAFLNWLHYYSGVIEPVLTVQFSTMTADDLFVRSFRGPQELSDRLTSVLERQDHLLGDGFSAADLLISAPFIWFPAMAPDTGPVQRWIKSCAARPGFSAAAAADAALLRG